MATVKELEEQLAEARHAEAEGDRERRKAQDVAWKAIMADPANWEWSVTPREYSNWLGRGDSPPVEALQIHKRVKAAVLQEWIKGGPSTFSTDWQEPDRWFGMVYYRTDEGILTHGGGGHLVLKDPKLCSDAEWEEMKAGRIPAKFIKESC